MKNLLMRAVTLAALLGLLVVAPIFAQDTDERGAVLLGDDLHVVSGQVIIGDAVVLGGDLDMDEGSRIEGDVVVLGGSVTVNGEVTGQVAAIGGTVHLGPTAIVGSDVAAIGGSLEREEGAVVRGEAVQTDEFSFKHIPFPPNFGPDREHGFWSAGSDLINAVKNVVLAITLAVVMGVIGLLVVLLLPGQTQVVKQTVVDAPWASLGIGLLTLAGAISVILFLCVTCCLSPLGLLLGLVLVVATLFGWTAVGVVLGARLTPLLKTQQPVSSLWSALLGVFVLTLVQHGLLALGVIPCLGIFFFLLGGCLWLAVVSIGLGAVVLSRFGTQRYIVLHPHREPPSALPPQAAFLPGNQVPRPAADQSEQTVKPTAVPDGRDDEIVPEATDALAQETVELPAAVDITQPGAGTGDLAPQGDTVPPSPPPGDSHD